MSLELHESEFFIDIKLCFGYLNLNFPILDLIFTSFLQSLRDKYSLYSLFQILLEIFEYLNVSDLLACSLVNHHWHELINRHCSVLQDRLRLCLTPYRCKLIENNPQLLQRNYKKLSLKKLTIVDIPRWLPRQLADIEDIIFVYCVFESIWCFRAVVMCFGQLKRMELRDVTLIHDDNIDLVAGNTKCYRTIERFAYTLTDERMMGSWKLMQAFQLLSPFRLLVVDCDLRADIKWCDIKEFLIFLLNNYANVLRSFDCNLTNLVQLLRMFNLTKCLRLEHFGVREFYMRCDHNFQLFMQQQAQNLASLRLENATAQSLLTIGHHLTKLTSLEVSFADYGPLFKQILRNLQLLRVLVLNPTQSTDFKFDLPAALERLEVSAERYMLDFLFVPTQSSIKLVPTKQPAYVHMNKLLLDNVYMHEKSFQVVFGKMPNLKQLEVINTNGSLSASVLTGRIGREQQPHSLKDLKRLKYLCLDDFLVKNAVLFEVQAPDLQEFRVNSCWERTVSL
jgi:F-box-like